MKKLLSCSLAAAIALSASICALSACKPEHEHVYGEWQQTVAPKCEQEGKKERVCECGEKEEEAIPATGHSWKPNNDAVSHWSECNACDAKKDVEVHDGNPCADCGFTVYSERLEFKLNSDETGYILAGIGECADTALVVPATYENKPVVAVDGFAFKDNKDVTAVRLPASVKTISTAAFMYCTNLASVYIPEGVERIEGSVFNGCTALDNVVLPDSIKFIGGLAFENTKHYNDATKWDQGVLYMGKHLIKAKNLTGECVIREDTITIGTYAFTLDENENVNHVTSINVPASVVYIGVGAFGDCDDLTTLTVAEGNAAYRSAGNCVIEKATGRLIAGINTSEIPDDGSVKIIGEAAFRLDNIEEINIPVSVVEIEAYAFQWCDKLWRINYAGTQSEWKEVKLGTGWKPMGASWFVIKCTDGIIY